MQGIHDPAHQLMVHETPRCRVLSVLPYTGQRGWALLVVIVRVPLEVVHVYLVATEGADDGVLRHALDLGGGDAERRVAVLTLDQG